MKVAINTCFGGFGLSNEAIIRYSQKSKTPVNDDRYYNLNRHDPILIEIISELGEEVNSEYSKIKIIEIPDGTDYEIHDYDGKEWVSEKHKKWSY